MALLERPRVVGADLEALFKEARRRRRRRWMVGVALALVIASISTTVALAIQGPDRPSRPVPTVPGATPGPRPTVDVRAFSGLGQLAFVSRNALWVLDGETHHLRQVILPNGLTPVSPTFSPDGRWLAFVTGSRSVHGSLWIAHSDGTDAHRTAGLVLGEAFGWNPHSDLYAVAAGPLSTRAPFGQPTNVRLVSPSGRSRIVASAPAIVGAVWSPTGTSLAVSTLNNQFVPSLTSYTVAGDRPTAWNPDPEQRPFFVVPAGWWNGWGVVYTVIDNGAVPDGEGGFENAALYSLSGPDATPHLLGETLTNDSDGPPSATSAGLLTFVSAIGQADPRAPWYGKQVEVCSSSTLSCSAAPLPPGDVTDDPVWSPSGSTLAYVAAPSENTMEFLAPAVSSWYASHVLQLYNPESASAAPVETATGATVPIWSSNGKGLLYVANNGLWLLPYPTAQPTEVASPLFGQATSPLSGPGIPSYYGEIDWSQQFGWSRAALQTQCYVDCNTALPSDQAAG